jgi:hypothetical protein
MPDPAQNLPNLQEEEVVTTARTPPATAGLRSPAAQNSSPPESGTSVVREWVNELTGRTEQQNAGIRIPTEGEITHLTSMFPDISRETVAGALQRRFLLLSNIITKH